MTSEHGSTEASGSEPDGADADVVGLGSRATRLLSRARAQTDDRDPCGELVVSQALKWVALPAGGGQLGCYPRVDFEALASRRKQIARAARRAILPEFTIAYSAIEGGGESEVPDFVTSNPSAQAGWRQPA